MRNPKNVLESLTSKAASKDYHYQRLYRNLYNPAFYLLAYERIQAKPGNMTAGSDGKTIDGMSMKRIEALIQKLRDFSYQPKPARRTYIPKANGKTRPLGIPSFDDKLVQEVDEAGYSVAVGTATHSAGGIDMEVLVKSAETRMYLAKEEHYRLAGKTRG